VMCCQADFAANFAYTIEVMHVTAMIGRAKSGKPTRPLACYEIVDGNHVVKRTRYPQPVLEAGDAVDIPQGKWGPDFAGNAKPGIQHEDTPNLSRPDRFVVRTGYGIPARRVKQSICILGQAVVQPRTRVYSPKLVRFEIDREQVMSCGHKNR
jgi:hypothetical protein